MCSKGKLSFATHPMLFSIHLKGIIYVYEGKIGDIYEFPFSVTIWEDIYDGNWDDDMISGSIRGGYASYNSYAIITQPVTSA